MKFPERVCKGSLLFVSLYQLIKRATHIMKNRDYEVMDKVFDKLRGMENKSITLTKEKLHPTDNFIILGYGYDECTITFKRRYDGIWVVHFSNDDPILLEDCPMSFFHTLLKNL